MCKIDIIDYSVGGAFLEVNVVGGEERNVCWGKGGEEDGRR
jgi:hypothetical protein